MKNYEDMTKVELWSEIFLLVDSTHFSDTDKDLFLKLIQEFGLR